MPAPVFDLAACSTTLGGVPLPASGEDEFLSFDLPPEFFTTDSNDGSRIRSMNPARKNGKVTITTHRTSVCHKRLALLFAEQRAVTERATTGTFPGLPFGWTDNSNGDSLIAESAAIEQAPAPSIGTQAGTVQWVIDLAGVKRSYAALVADTPSV